MTNMELLVLFGEARSDYIQQAQDVRSGSRTREKKHLSARKLCMLIAAVIAAMALALTAYAAINARIQIQMTHNEDMRSEERTKLCSIYPQSIPEGYNLLSGALNSADVRELYYWKDSGTEIEFVISFEQELAQELSGEKIDTAVSGHPAALYHTDSTRCLLWKNSSEGYTAYLRTNDPDADILVMAESVGIGEILPESFAKDLSAETNGLWYPQWMPDDYEIREVSPVSDGGQSITFARIHADGSSDSIRYVISMTRDLSDIRPAPSNTVVWEDADIAGTPGRMVTIGGHQKLLFWKNEAEGFNAMLMTGVMDEDLTAIAASVGPGKKLEISPMYTQSPEYSVQMEQEDTYVAFEPWYPQQLPDGYEIAFVSDKLYGEQTVRYGNEKGEMIRYTLCYRLDQWPRGYEGDLIPEEVDIHGATGYLVRSEQLQELFWVNEEKGFGFALSTGSDVDILEIARSVALGEELPATNADKTVQALEQLGDYQITALPEGMQEDGVSGWPKENADDWYSYVRRRYICPADNRQITMEYSTCVLEDSTAQEAACMAAGVNSKSAQVAGCVGAYLESGGHNTVSWINETENLSFTLYSDDFSAAELMAMAESIQKKN